MTSAFDDQTLQGLTYATSFPMPSTYTAPASEDFRTPTDVDQNLFDEPFMLDVNFEQIAFDDFAVNMDNVSDGAASHFYPRDPNTYVRLDPPFLGGMLMILFLTAYVNWNMCSCHTPP